MKCSYSGQNKFMGTTFLVWKCEASKIMKTSFPQRINKKLCQRPRKLLVRTKHFSDPRNHSAFQGRERLLLWIKTFAWTRKTVLICDSHAFCLPHRPRNSMGRHHAYFASTGGEKVLRSVSKHTLEWRFKKSTTYWKSHDGTVTHDENSPILLDTCKKVLIWTAKNTPNVEKQNHSP